jgi:hypothetical protein
MILTGSWSVLLTIPNNPDPTPEGESSVTFGFSRWPFIPTGIEIRDLPRISFIKGVLLIKKSMVFKGATKAVTSIRLLTTSIYPLKVQFSEYDITTN